MKVQHRIVAATALSLALVVNGASTTAFAGGAKPARLVIGVSGHEKLPSGGQISPR